MYCEKCGIKIPDGSEHCNQCGYSVTGNIHPHKNKLPKKHNILMILIPVFLVIIVGTIITLMYVRQLKVNKEYVGKLEAAEDCLNEEDFEGALRNYKYAIHILPRKPEAYKDLADVYIMQEKPEKAINVLETGYKNSGDASLLDLKKELEKEAGIESSDEEQKTENHKDKSAKKKNVNLSIRQVDNSKFPQVTFYANITDDNGQIIEDITKNDFDIQEINADGNVFKTDITEVHKVINQDQVKVNLVMDASGSMSYDEKMTQAKQAATSLIQQMNLKGGDKAELIAFDSYVYLVQDFTRQEELLTTGINGIIPGSSTALYDAIYAGLYQTYLEEGVKCVIAFTDGEENASSYTFDDIVSMAQNTSIPVFIIGIGNEYDIQMLQNLATECSGQYYSANVDNLEQVLEDIYVGIYHEQQDSYMFQYTSNNTENVKDFRKIVLQTSEESEFTGSYTKEYVPQSDVSGAFSNDYLNKDYIFEFSGQRMIAESELNGLSLAELRIARNEIFARHGRQFKDPFLNQWFYSKAWYLNIPTKYSPDDFDSIRPSPLNKTELDNIDVILNYEERIMSTQMIYPNAGTQQLSEYDLALSKEVLKTALEQMRSMASTTILKENVQAVEDTINQSEIKY